MEKAIEEKDDNQPPASGGTGNDKDSISEELPEDVKTQNAASAIRKVDGFERVNINTFCICCRNCL